MTALWRLSTSGLLLCLLAQPLLAQSSTSSIVGEVLDDAGAGLQGVVVTVRGVATGLGYTTLSNPEGLFWVEGLPAGLYDITVETVGLEWMRHSIEPPVIEPEQVWRTYVPIGAAIAIAAVYFLITRRESRDEPEDPSTGSSSMPIGEE